MSQINLEQLNLTQSLAQKLKMTTDVYLAAFRKIVLANLKGNISVEEIVSLLTVAERYDIDPFLREFYASRTPEGKVIPLLTYDGWVRIVNRHPEYNGEAFVYSDDKVNERHTGQEVYEWIECAIHRKDRGYPTVVREFFRENYQDAAVNPQDASHDLGSWQKLPNRRLRMQAFVQTARLAFGVSGIYHQQDLQPVSDVKSSPAVEAPAPKQIEQTFSAIPLHVNREKVKAIVDPLVQRAKELNAWMFVEQYLRKSIPEGDDLQFALQMAQEAKAECESSPPVQEQYQPLKADGTESATPDVSTEENDVPVEVSQDLNVISSSTQSEATFGVIP
ncbi:recombinase RecT [Pseudovibrio sp. Ad37]|uniref:recombinase RecT n=1 Tax=Pseudovibrio sp. Ad37 TaxID=989422 RepID=UPI0007B2F40D|nr:recombinase RecT [Pseudovibrio sp. Ad37]KZL22671.1 RecT family protein [Pseudovibrio sp. Ad37]